MKKGNGNIALLLLAAGESSRMGSPKQLLPWKETTLLGRAINNAKKSRVKDIFVVIGANEQEIRRTHAGSSVHWILNKDWREGMGTSISIALQKVLEKGDLYDAVLVMLCDQPLIDRDYLNAMISAFESNTASIICTSYAQANGVPAIFSRKHFWELQQLDGNSGARKIIAQYPNQTFALQPGGKEVDLDTPEIYKTLFEKYK